ncbi:MAG TPA: DNA replication and repair protein RecF, partial [Kofleriaceae bacterium]|nr:DNA replication and repair protein RecF [Kofleriaceae bacterium]
MRNLRPLSFEPRERFNVFSGDNGQGKTNLLEAIFAIAALRSFRTSKLSDLIAFGAEKATLAARVWKDELVRVYEVALAPGSRQVKLDGKAVRPLARYFGGFNVVVFTPEDLALPRASPADRRRFLDRSVFNLQPDYLTTAQNYERVLKTRNAVLRQASEGTADRRQVEALLAVYDQQLAEIGARVIAARIAFLDVLRDELATAFASITRTGLATTARYVARSAAVTPDELVAKLAASRVKDFATSATQVGPHRDDVVFELDGRDAGTYASQGQLRA